MATLCSYMAIGAEYLFSLQYCMQVRHHDPHSQRVHPAAPQVSHSRQRSWPPSNQRGRSWQQRFCPGKEPKALHRIKFKGVYRLRCAVPEVILHLAAVPCVLVAGNKLTCTARHSFCLKAPAFLCGCLCLEALPLLCSELVPALSPHHCSTSNDICLLIVCACKSWWVF